jgi:dihydroorotase-like cyclic amidohydrolase
VPVDILVTDGVIRRFDRAGTTRPPADVVPIDLHGLFVMPGAVDGQSVTFTL